MGSEFERNVSISCLKRIDPYIRDILAKSNQVRIFQLNPVTTRWEKIEVEGSAFLCVRHGEPFYNFIVINRLNSTDIVQPILVSMNFQLRFPFLVYRNADSILGIWFTNFDECMDFVAPLDSILKELNMPTTIKDIQQDDGQNMYNILSHAYNDHVKQVPKVCDVSEDKRPTTARKDHPEQSSRIYHNANVSMSNSRSSKSSRNKWKTQPKLTLKQYIKQGAIPRDPSKILPEEEEEGEEATSEFVESMRTAYLTKKESVRKEYGSVKSTSTSSTSTVHTNGSCSKVTPHNDRYSLPSCFSASDYGTRNKLPTKAGSNRSEFSWSYSPPKSRIPRPSHRPSTSSVTSSKEQSSYSEEFVEIPLPPQILKSSDKAQVPQLSSKPLPLEVLPTAYRKKLVQKASTKVMKRASKEEFGLPKPPVPLKDHKPKLQNGETKLFDFPDPPNLRSSNLRRKPLNENYELPKPPVSPKNDKHKQLEKVPTEDSNHSEQPKFIPYEPLKGAPDRIFGGSIPAKEDACKPLNRALNKDFGSSKPSVLEKDDRLKRWTKAAGEYSGYSLTSKPSKTVVNEDVGSQKPPVIPKDDKSISCVKASAEDSDFPQPPDFFSSTLPIIPEDDLPSQWIKAPEEDSGYPQSPDVLSSTLPFIPEDDLPSRWIKAPEEDSGFPQSPDVLSSTLPIIPKDDLPRRWIKAPGEDSGFPQPPYFLTSKPVTNFVNDAIGSQKPLVISEADLPRRWIKAPGKDSGFPQPPYFLTSKPVTNFVNDDINSQKPSVIPKDDRPEADSGFPEPPYCLTSKPSKTVVNADTDLHKPPVIPKDDRPRRWIKDPEEGSGFPQPPYFLTSKPSKTVVNEDIDTQIPHVIPKDDKPELCERAQAGDSYIPVPPYFKSSEPSMTAFEDDFRLLSPPVLSKGVPIVREKAPLDFSFDEPPYFFAIVNEDEIPSFYSADGRNTWSKGPICPEDYGDYPFPEGIDDEILELQRSGASTPDKCYIPTGSFVLPPKPSQSGDHLPDDIDTLSLTESFDRISMLENTEMPVLLSLEECTDNQNPHETPEAIAKDQTEPGPMSEQEMQEVVSNLLRTDGKFAGKMHDVYIEAINKKYK